MTDLKSIHRKAMEEADLSFIAKQRGDEASAMRHSIRAYEFETEAAASLITQFDNEPTRSILYRSAATLARDCGKLEEATKLIYKALAGNPSLEMVEELQDLLEDVNFKRHLVLRGISLSEEEIQMAIAGQAVGFGVAPTDLLISRVKSTESLLYRTAERRFKRPYRDKGRRDGSLSNNLELFMTVPRAASFAVTFRVGANLQLALPGLSFVEEIIDEFVDCLKIYSDGKESELRNRIKDDAYYRNFVGLAQNLQPDGSKVKTVGFTTVRRGIPKYVAMNESPRANSLIETEKSFLRKSRRKLNEETISLRGELRIADSVKKSDSQSGTIQILDASGKLTKVIVPPGMMSDIVKPLWEREVEITGVAKGKKIQLVQIRASQ